MHNPTVEQTAIIEAAQNGADNLIVYARAGAAKTTTLEMLTCAMPETDFLCLAFNKRIQIELSERLPKNAKTKTMNGLGHAAIARFISGRITLDKNKIYRLVSAWKDKLSQEEKDKFFPLMGETIRLIGLTKNWGWIPENYSGHWRPLCTDEEAFFSFPIEPDELQERCIFEVAKLSWQEALNGTIDFDDQILFPAVCAVSFDSPTITLVDEAQDLSPTMHRILKKLVRNKRIIAVGDPYQAIYGFRGADTKSMDNLRDTFSMKVMSLTTSFRCGKNIIELAQSRAPDINAPDWAKEGEVTYPPAWSSADVPEECAIICRNNEPLFRAAIRLLREKRRPQILGRDIVKNLTTTLKKLSKKNLESEEALARLELWYEKEKKRTREKGVLSDRYACMKLFLSEAETIEGAIALAQEIENQKGNIQLMTGHKAKGLEFDTVFFLDPQILRDEEQDLNVRYVIQTRAKSRLIHVNSDNWQKSI